MVVDLTSPGLLVFNLASHPLAAFRSKPAGAVYHDSAHDCDDGDGTVGEVDDGGETRIPQLPCLEGLCLLRGMDRI